MTTSTALPDHDVHRQSLAHGLPGPTLLALERAVITGHWEPAHTMLRTSLNGPVDAGDHTGLYYGAPALTFLTQTAAHHDPRYHRTARTLHAHVLDLTDRRLTTAAERSRSDRRTSFAEYDLFYGLTGIATLLLHTLRLGGPDDHTEHTLHRLLHHLAALTRPRRDNGAQLPGWWVDHDPDRTITTPGGHANLGTAHGAAGLLALFALTALDGHRIDDHHEPINRLVAVFDDWRHPGGIPAWPTWITRDDLRRGPRPRHSTERPSWCYGAPGILNALRLAARATGDDRRQDTAGRELAAVIASSSLPEDGGLCHARPGIAQIARRTGHPINLGTCTPTSDRSFLTGSSGTELAQLAQIHSPCTGWDLCLLIA